MEGWPLKPQFVRSLVVSCCWPMSNAKRWWVSGRFKRKEGEKKRAAAAARRRSTRAEGCLGTHGSAGWRIGRIGRMVDADGTGWDQKQTARRIYWAGVAAQSQCRCTESALGLRRCAALRDGWNKNSELRTVLSPGCRSVPTAREWLAASPPLCLTHDTRKDGI